MNRRSFLRTGAASTAILLADPSWCVEEDASRPADSELLAQTRSSIVRHRTGDTTIRISDRDGKPVPGVKVRVEQIRHEFLFGCNGFLFGRCGDLDQEQAYRQRFAALFNYCTLGFYWAAYEIARGKPNYAYTDEVLEWTAKQGIVCKGHPLVWDHPAGSPPWLPDEPETIARLVSGRVKEIVSRYRGRIDIWDVVNEATHLPDGVNKTKMAAWGAGVGPIDYAAEPLRIARAANPAATLLVNDYRTDHAYFQLLSRLHGEHGLLLNAVGIQSHMHEGAWPLHKIFSTCETYRTLGLPIHFTETTILSEPRNKHDNAWEPTNTEREASQAQEAANFYTILFAHPAVHALTWWDFSDYHAWQHAPAGLLREDMSPKPAYEQLLHLIKKQWWTTAEGRTDDHGSFSFRAFYGSHSATIEGPNGRKTKSELQVQRGQANQFELKI